MNYQATHSKKGNEPNMNHEDDTQIIVIDANVNTRSVDPFRVKLLESLVFFVDRTNHILNLLDGVLIVLALRYVVDMNLVTENLFESLRDISVLRPIIIKKPLSYLCFLGGFRSSNSLFFGS